MLSTVHDTDYSSMLKGVKGQPPRMITINVGDPAGTNYQVFYVLATVLCQHSAFFRGALEGQFSEAHSDQVDLPEDDPILFSHILLWMHGQDYSFPVPFLFGETDASAKPYTFTTTSAMTNTLNFLILADKLLLEPNPAGHIALKHMTNLMRGGRELTADNIRLAYKVSSARPVALFFAKHSVAKYIATMSNQAFTAASTTAFGSTTQKLLAFEFAKELQEVSGYAADLLNLVALAIRDGRDETSQATTASSSPNTRSSGFTNTLQSQSRSPQTQSQQRKLFFKCPVTQKMDSVLLSVKCRLTTKAEAHIVTCIVPFTALAIAFARVTAASTIAQKSGNKG